MVNRAGAFWMSRRGEVRVVIERDETGAIDVDATLGRIIADLRELARMAPPDKARSLLDQARRLEALVESRTEPR
jgi:hypothetical protein